MKIIGLKAQNIKNIKAVEIMADGKTVTLSGKNESGKSSIIDAITMALTGKMIERPIRDGESRGEVELDLGEYIVRRIWTGDNNRLEVMSKDHAKYQSPQTLLNGIIGQLAFDPLAFKNMDRKPQRDLLVRLVGLDFAEHDARRKALFDERTLQNRKLSDCETMVQSYPIPEGDFPEKEVSFAAELARINEMQSKRKAWETECRKITANNSEKERAHQKQVSEMSDAIQSCLESIQSGEQKIKDLQAEIERISSQNSVLHTSIERMKQELANVPPLSLDDFPPEEIPQAQIDAAQQDLTKIEGINAKVRQAQQARSFLDQCEKQRKVVSDLSAAIEKMDSEKDAKINSVKFPIDGLGVNDDCVLYNGLPFLQASEGVKIRVSTAIAMKLNPKLRTIFVKEGSLLDSEGKKTLIAMAKENDYQMFIEEVSDDVLKINIEE